MKKSLIVITILILTIILTGCGIKTGDNVKNTYESISAEQAKKIIDEQSGFIILDVRTKEEYDQGHIPDAVPSPNEITGTDEIAVLPDKEQLILVYCRSGNRSKQAAAKLVNLGYTNVREFGGIIDWPYDIVTK